MAAAALVVVERSVAMLGPVAAAVVEEGRVAAAGRVVIETPVTTLGPVAATGQAVA